MSLACRKWLTETTNGFRAVRLACLDDPRLRLDQRWLDGYGLEVYLLYKMIACGFHHMEVPCTKIYPPKKLGITKMLVPASQVVRHITDPCVLLSSGLGI